VSGDGALSCAAAPPDEVWLHPLRRRERGEVLLSGPGSPAQEEPEKDVPSATRLRLPDQMVETFRQQLRRSLPQDISVSTSFEVQKIPTTRRRPLSGAGKFSTPATRS